MTAPQRPPRTPVLRPRPSRRSGLLPLLVLAAAAGCSEAPRAGATAAAATPADSLEVEWTTLTEQSLEDRPRTPEAFRASEDTLRVITTMGEAITPLSRGVVYTNILSGETGVPLASVHAEPLRADSLSADTALVAVEPGELYLYVAQHRGLRDWRITVQERRR